MRCVISLCLLSIAMPVLAEVYRWVDAAGRAHYSDHVPADLRDKATRVNIKAGPVQIDPEAERARRQLRSIEDARQRERTFEAQKAAQEQQRRAQLAQRCKSLQNEIRDDQRAAVFYRYDEKGNRILWTSEERLAYREKLQQLKQTYCPALSD